MDVSTILTIIALLALIIVWLSRFLLIKRIIEDVFVYKKGIDSILLFNLFKEIAFDVFVILILMMVVGNTNSIFAIQMVIWINAITTFFVKYFIKVSTDLSK
jgi:hypothetical protein